MKESGMSDATKLMVGITLILMPTIEFGGYFLLGLLVGDYPELNLSDLQRSFFRAGHAHAGVLVILSIICQVLVDYARLSNFLAWTVRIALFVSGMFVSGGFFLSVIGEVSQQPNSLIGLIYLGIFTLSFGLITLGVGLIRARERISS